MLTIYSIIMAENQLPKISPETREKLNSYGFTNHLYDYLNLPSYLTPRGRGFDAYTYAIMGLSMVGVVVAKKYGSVPLPFVAAFITAPFIAFYQKKEADFNFISDFSKRNPAQLLQQYPLLNQSFKEVCEQADAEIARYQERIHLLEEKLSRRQ